MYPTGRNLLYTLNQALNPGFITNTHFLRYARTDEDRTFKKYFKRNCPFTRYLRTGDARALFRYISHHRRQNDPVLKSRTFNFPSFLLKIQRLRTRIITRAKAFQPNSNDPRKHLFLQNEPNFIIKQNDVSHFQKANCLKLKAKSCRKKRTQTNPICSAAILAATKQ